MEEEYIFLIRKAGGIYSSHNQVEIMKYIKVILFNAIFLFIAVGCIGESDKFIKDKLLVILQDDLETVVNETPKESIEDSVYYEIVLYKEYKEGKYTKKAVVDFFFLKKVKVKIVRKYRYYAQYRKWDRYFNVYKFYDIAKNE